jgi:dTDP-4-amino-4,6-dideoxygalactose transaminase
VRIPLVDLGAQYARMKDEIDGAIAAVIRNAAFISGPYVEKFEAEFADYCGTRFAIGMSNGTDALRVALLACNVKPADEVIVPVNTFIATAEAVSMIGARVRFVDVRPSEYGIDAHQVKAAINSQTRAVIPVHLYGYPADIDSLNEIALTYGLSIVGDAAQAHGALYHGRPVGTLGDVVCFSFYPGKNLGAYGDAGAVVTNDPEIARRAAMLRDHGRVAKYEHEIEGLNCRMDGLQAAILSVKLKHLEDWTERRRTHAATYNRLLAGIDTLVLPRLPDDMRAVFHLYVVRTPRRNELQKVLSDAGIATGIHYPIPLHLQQAYAYMHLNRGAFPVAEEQADQILSLPLYPEMEKEQIDYICDSIHAFFRA